MPTAAITVSRVGRRRIEPDLSTYSGRLAARVRELREAKGWSIKRLADKAGIPVPTLYGYENGGRDIPPDAYPRLAKALGCKRVADFFPEF